MFYKILEVEGKWVVQKSPTGKGNWVFLGQGENPMDAFGHIEGSAGNGDDVVFLINKENGG